MAEIGRPKGTKNRNQNTCKRTMCRLCVSVTERERLYGQDLTNRVIGSLLEGFEAEFVERDIRTESVSINLPQAIDQRLNKMAETIGISKQEVLRQILL